MPYKIGFLIFVRQRHDIGHQSVHAYILLNSVPYYATLDFFVPISVKKLVYLQAGAWDRVIAVKAVMFVRGSSGKGESLDDVGIHIENNCGCIICT